jgi:release factor glutamine methyltransferase
VAEERRTAGVLLCHVLTIERTHLLTRSEECVSDDDYESFLRLVARRSTGEPLQYITGHQEFYGRDFNVTPDVLIPRPETEFLVERVIKLANNPRSTTSPLIVDIGTGSGCVAITLAVQLPRARLIASDISAAALDIARANAARHNVAARIEFMQGDALSPLARLELNHAVDFIASNPPYVSERGSELIQREVREWEPHRALFGGVDGLDFYRRLLADSVQYLRPGGYLVLEIGYDQLASISDLIAGSSWELVDVIRDLQNIPRTLSLKQPSENLLADSASRLVKQSG